VDGGGGGGGVDGDVPDAIGNVTLPLDPELS
jgi:hypothetical protein